MAYTVYTSTIGPLRCILLRELYLAGILAIALSALLSLTSATNVGAEEQPVLIRGEIVPINARLLQNGSYGDPVPEQQLDFYDQSQNSFIESATTDINGWAAVYWNLTSNHPLGPTLLNVTFDGNDTLSLAPSCQWMTVMVVSNTQMSVLCNQSTFHPEDQILFTVGIIDDHNKAITDAVIAVYHDQFQLAVGITNDSGYASFNIECNMSWGSYGKNRLRVVYEPAVTSFHNMSEHLFEIDIEQIPTAIRLEDSNGTQFELNELFWLKLTVNAAGENPQNATLDTLIDGEFVGTITADIQGVSELYIPIDTQLDLGPHKVRVQYNGTERYSFSFLEIDITVLSPALLHIMLPEHIVIGSSSEIQMQIHDLLGRPIPDATITLSDQTTDRTMSLLVPTDHTTVQFEFLFTGSVGIRSLLVAISGNPYLTNTSWTHWATVWLRPTISIIQSNTRGYASPTQQLSFHIQLNSTEGSLPFRSIECGFDETVLVSSVTDSEGLANMTLYAPEVIGHYTLFLKTNGSPSSYELPVKFKSVLVVSTLIPVDVNLSHYHINPALRELRVHLTLQCLNGTTLNGISILYEWLTHSGSATSTHSGHIELVLPLPANAGIYNLYYEIKGTSSLQPSTGNISITVSETEVLASQGVGIPGLVLSLCISIGLLGIPVLHRRYLIG
ncbi:MAG: hypothetical protein ACE5H4_04330 [Candidatus Thorarchaeota archaeon]